MKTEAILFSRNHQDDFSSKKTTSPPFRFTFSHNFSLQSFTSKLSSNIRNFIFQACCSKPSTMSQSSKCCINNIYRRALSTYQLSRNSIQVLLVNISHRRSLAPVLPNPLLASLQSTRRLKMSSRTGVSTLSPSLRRSNSNEMMVTRRQITLMPPFSNPALSRCF